MTERIRELEEALREAHWWVGTRNAEVAALRGALERIQEILQETRDEMPPSVVVELLDTLKTVEEKDDI